MLDLDENKALSDIFKEEDFETEEEFSSDEELDSALSEIAGLKETLSGVKTEQYPHTKSFARTEMRPKDMFSPAEVYSQPQMGADVLYGIKDELSSIRSSIATVSKGSNGESLRQSFIRMENAFNKLSSDVSKISNGSSNDAFTTSVIHQLVKIKKLIGSDNFAEVQLNNELNELYLLEQKATRYVENEGISFERKFAAVDDLVQRLREAYNYDVDPLVAKANALLVRISGKPLTKESLTALEAYANKGKDVLLTVARVKEIETYLTMSEKALLTTAEKAYDMLDEISVRKNSLCSDKRKTETDDLVSEYQRVFETLKNETNKESVAFLRTRANSILSELTTLTLGDVYDFGKIEIQKDFKVLKQPANKSIYETINELKSIISSGGVVSVDDGRTGIASDISYIKERLDIMQSDGGAVRINADGTESVAIAGSALTIETLVGQLDRLFDDIKNVADALESNVMDNLAIINDNVNIIKESVDKAVEKAALFAKSSEDVHEIKEIVSLRYNDDATSSDHELLSAIEKQTELINSLLISAEKMNMRMDEMSEEIRVLKSENAEIKSAVKKVFDEVDDNASSFDEIKGVLSELKNEVDDNGAHNTEELDEILGKINEAITSKK